MKTYVPKQGEIERKWYVVDASGKTLGRLASDIARVLRGKHKPMYTPNADVGDFVIVTNAGKIAVTGAKMADKMYYRHSGYPGGLKEVNLESVLRRNPERAIEEAVKGMLPHNKLGAAMLSKLKVYPGPAHPHEAQRPHNLSEAFPGGQPTGVQYGNEG
ncbi:MAG TPA: 50S ribosomal protein L13 [Chloroflexota bacterium]|nr:50S ribosomal protein L13 [Chloroflexota bacterium]